MAVDYRAKYELSVKELLSKLDNTTTRSLEYAEESIKASERYCAELKCQLEQANRARSVLTEELSSAQSELAGARAQLRQCQEERERGEQRRKKHNVSLPLPSVDPPESVEALLSAMTGLSARLEEGEGPDKRSYTCRVDHGRIVGHTFSLVLSTVTWEYTYSPLQLSATLPAEGSSLAEPLCFPDHMLGRFLTNLLMANFVE